MFANFRLINVTGAGYADCNGLYTISNHTAIWDNKRIVYERVVGGWSPMDKRCSSPECKQIFRTLEICRYIVDTFTGMLTTLERTSTGGVLGTLSPLWRVVPSTPRAG